MCHGGTLMDLPYKLEFGEETNITASTGSAPEDGHGLVVSSIMMSHQVVL
jgi:hypothetical protein